MLQIIFANGLEMWAFRVEHNEKYHMYHAHYVNDNGCVSIRSMYEREVIYVEGEG